MACRFHNRSSALLRIDLRGGVSLQLAPGATSDALAEELLYDNMFVQQWERDGLLVRLPARFAEVGVPSAVAPKKVERKPASDAALEEKEKDKKDKKSKSSKSHH